jgi:phosphotriesterase-related protein
MAHVMTVRGPVEPDQIGKTLMHEHIFLDARHAWDPSDLQDPSRGEVKFGPEHAAASRFSWHAFRDSMCQLPDDDYDLVRDEVVEFKKAGGGCIVELTLEGAKPAPEALRRISEELDLHVVAGCSWYVHATHPEWLETADVDAIAQDLLKTVRDGIHGTGVQPGIIGEIGTSEELFPCEERVLRAAAHVARQTGLPINIHCHPPELQVVMRILDVLQEEGHDMSRTYLSHLDEIEDLDYHEAVLSRGAIVGFDSFGHEGGYFTPTWRSRSDLEKMSTVVALVDRGYDDQLVLSQDMHRKHFLHHFGGYGYDHVLTRIVPRLQNVLGVSASSIQKMLIDNPRRFLAIA